jgi:hypothetical protein
MHQVFVGTRSLLYLGGGAGSGLSESLVWIAVGLAIGVLFGAGVTRSYDRRGHRPGTAVETPAGTATEFPHPEQ